MASFTDRMIGTAKLDVRIFEEVEADATATTQATGVVILSTLAGGIGGIGGGFVVASMAALIFWVTWAFLTYIIGARLWPEPQTHADTGQLMRTIGFAQAPGLLRVFGVVPLLGAPVVAIVQMLDFGRHGDWRAPGGRLHEHRPRRRRLRHRLGGRKRSGAPYLDRPWSAGTLMRDECLLRAMPRAGHCRN